MESVSIEFTGSELLELNRIIYLATCVTAGSPGYNSDMLDILEERLCAIGHLHFNEDKDYRNDLPIGALFQLTNKATEQVCEALDDYEHFHLSESIAETLMERDMDAKHGELLPTQIFDEALNQEYSACCEKYKMEILLNGLKNFYFKEDKPKKIVRKKKG